MLKFVQDFIGLPGGMVLHYYRSVSIIVIDSYRNKGDFLVDGVYTFEVGGKGKGFDQIKDMKNSFLSLDDIEIGVGNKIPLWLFGFLY